jgi:RNA polymerase sigma factor (sigma-70 family)
LLQDLRAHIDAEDVVQEVWMRALEIFHRYDKQRQEFRSWIFPVAKNMRMEAMRRVRAHGPSGSDQRHDAGTDFELEGLPESVTSISARIAREDSVRQFIEHAQSLDVVDQQLLVFVGLEGMSGDLAAKRLGLTRNAAFKRWQRLRERLRERGIGQELLES